jgi:hypothetical protein
MDLLIGIAIIAAVVAIWAVLDRYPAGRVVQAIVTTLAYGAWLSIIPLTIYFVGKDVSEALAENSYGKAAFIAVISLTFIPIFLLALIPWNFYCRYIWRKVGLKLPQMSKFGGEREYYDWERQR